MEETRWEGQNFSEVVVSQEEEEDTGNMYFIWKKSLLAR